MVEAGELCFLLSVAKIWKKGSGLEATCGMGAGSTAIGHCGCLEEGGSGTEAWRKKVAMGVVGAQTGT